MDLGSLPPITGTWVAAALVLSVMDKLNLVTHYQLFFSPNLVFRLNQYWRLITTFLYFGGFGVEFIFHIFFVMHYGQMLEENTYGRARRAEFAWLLLVACTALLAISPWLSMPFLASPLASVLVYVWSRRNRHVQMRIFGIIGITAPYLPVTLALLGWVFQGTLQSIKYDLVGITIGHLCTCCAHRCRADIQTTSSPTYGRARCNRAVSSCSSRRHSGTCARPHGYANTGQAPLDRTRCGCRLARPAPLLYIHRYHIGHLDGVRRADSD